MAISKTEDLFLLIKSLTKSEKRSFRLYAERIRDTQQLEYMKLFDIIDKAKEVDDESFKNILGLKNNTQYSNYKRHLYEQILISLRMTKKSGFSNIKVRELIDFTYLLYSRGFHMQALKALSRAKALAIKEDLEFSLLTILEIEKMIHSRHITRAAKEPISEIISESSMLAATIHNRVKLSNLRLLMHKYYIEHGHAKNEAEEKKVISTFKKSIKNIKEHELSKAEQIHINQAFVWYYYILNDFNNCFLYSKKWIDLFDVDNLSKLDVNLYFRAYHYLLVSLFYIRDKKRFQKYYELLSEFRLKHYSKFDDNTKILSFLYVHQARLNYYIINRQYAEGIKIIPKTERRLKSYKVKLDDHKVMIFHFKMAWIFLMGDQPAKALRYLHFITNMSNNSLRIDIQIYARLMNLMVQYDLGHESILPSLIRNYKRFIIKQEAMQETHKRFLEYMTQNQNTALSDRKALCKKHIRLIEEMKKNRFEKRALIYLDLTEWMRTQL